MFGLKAPHELKEIHLTNCICDQLIKREENDLFLKRSITGEKWIVYNNISRKRSWSRQGEAPERQAKAENQKKVMLSMWDWKGPVFYELFPKNKTINSDVYCEQLQKLSNAIAQKRPKLINRKSVVLFITTMRDHTQVWSLGKNCCNMVGMCYHIHRIAQTLHHQTSISFAPCKTP